MSKMSELRTVDVKNAKWVTFAEMRANAAAKAEAFEKQMKQIEERECFVCSKPAPDGMIMFQSGEALVVHEEDCLAKLKSS